MVLFKNADITIYNKYINKTTGIEAYQRTVITGVHWQGKKTSTVSTNGLLVADSVLLIIDRLDNYVLPKAFKKLTDIQRPNFFTFGIGDKIVKGNIDFEITGVNPYRIANLESAYDEVINIVSVLPCSNHFEVEGK